MNLFRDLGKCIYWLLVVAISVIIVGVLGRAYPFCHSDAETGMNMNGAKSKRKGNAEERRIAEKLACAINFWRKFLR